MNDPFVPAEEIKKELKELEELGITLSRNISSLLHTVRYIISKIRLCPTLESAEYYFDLLDHIQSTLACLVFREKIDIPDRLRKFVSDFDNFEGDKAYLFQAIKNDQYVF